MNKCSIAIFASGDGSNAENIINYFKGNDAVNVVLIVSNRAGAGVLQRAEKLEVPHLLSQREELNNPTFLLLLEQQKIRPDRFSWISFENPYLLNCRFF